MDKSSTLYRSDNFPYERDQNNMNQHFYETLDGWYSVIIDDNTDEFVLATPQGKQIEDCFSEIDKRKDLYHYDDGFIFDWLKHVEDKVYERRKRKGETQTSFEIDGIKYQMRINIEKEKVWLTIPKQTRIFKITDMYIENPDLPLLRDGLLDDEVRKKLERIGLQLPKVPYKVALGISAKITNT